MRRHRADESELWRRAMRDVAPLPGRRPPPLAPSLSTASAAGQVREKTGGDNTDKNPTHRTRAATLPPLDRHAGIDRASVERLQRGRYPIQARLDLHGLTQAQAHRALAGFVAAARADGQRCVLVVTGHGRSSGGILKTEVPRWLDEPGLRRHVLAIAPARSQDGGGGALYVLLRRERATTRR